MTGKKYDPTIHHRRSIRLKDRDYSLAGSYFVTICTNGRACLFGEVGSGGMTLNAGGLTVEACWQQLAVWYENISLDVYIIMPDHIHGIIGIDESNSQINLGNIIGRFKSHSTHVYMQGMQQHNWTPFAGKLWQRNYYERIIRHDDELQSIRQYII